jgi:outer membrane receptor protein involved in Fe transport
VYIREKICHTLARFLFLISTALFAPDLEALEGTIRDPEGNPISEAQVSLYNSQQSVVASSSSDGDGKFSFPNVQPGNYFLLVRAKGFADYRKSAEIKGIPDESIEVQVGLEAVSEEVTVTASRDRVEPLAQVPQQVNVISQDEIGERAKAVLAQVANEEVGVHLQRTSPTLGGIFVRGLTGNKVNVFVDGVRYSNSGARGGINTFLNLIDPASLETVEILRGPSSSLYGSDAIGGSVQLLSRVPTFTPEGSELNSGFTSFANSADQGYGSSLWTSYSAPSFALLASASGHRVNEIRPGEGIDSHNAVTRFFDLPSEVAVDENLPFTDFTQYGGMLKFAWTPAENSQITASYMRGQQDDGKRYDQLIGGDGNLIADLRNLMLDFFYLKYDHSQVGWFDHFSAGYSFNSQREERVNQGGNGNPLAAINHEYERTSVHGFQAQLSKALSANQAITFGADYYAEGINSPSFREDPVTHEGTVRRGRIPDDATFNHGGVFGEYTFDAIPETLRIITNLRYSFADYTAEAADSPIVNGEPLWPNDSVDVDSVTYRVGTVWSAAKNFQLLANFSRGFRAPHMTDLGTLGLTGSGFEVSAPDVAGLDGTVGSTADSNAVSTGVGIEQLKPETNQMYEVGARYQSDRFDTNFAFFVNDIDDNITKQSLILPQGAVGLTLGDETIVAQNPNGVVFVGATSSPVLVRTNLDDARIYGFEHTLNFKINSEWSGGTIFTYLHSEDKRTGLAPNIEGGTPAPDGYVKVRYKPERKSFWIEPYVHFSFAQDRLSTLDREDRRTGAGRSRSSITNFFLNGARARGLVNPGTDGVFGTPDDFLIETGETLQQILVRVLGADLQSNSLFDEVEGYATFNIRFGFRLGDRHNFLVELENLSDENYRGISWGVDAPGRGVYVRYSVGF